MQTDTLIYTRTLCKRWYVFFEGSVTDEETQSTSSVLSDKQYRLRARDQTLRDKTPSI